MKEGCSLFHKFPLIFYIFAIPFLLFFILVISDEVLDYVFYERWFDKFGYVSRYERYDGILPWGEQSYEREDCLKNICVSRVFSKSSNLEYISFAYFDQAMPTKEKHDDSIYISNCHYVVRYGYFDLRTGVLEKNLQRNELLDSVKSKYLVNNLKLPNYCLGESSL